MSLQTQAGALLAHIESLSLFQKAADLLKKFEADHPEIAEFFGAHGEAHAKVEEAIANAKAALPEAQAKVETVVNEVKAEAASAVAAGEAAVQSAVAGDLQAAETAVSAAVSAGEAKVETELGSVVGDVAAAAASTQTPPQGS